MPTLEQLRARDYQAAMAKGPTGLGGWLILPLIGMLASPVANAIVVLNSLDVLGPGYVLTTQQAFAVRFELAQAVVIGVAPIGLLVLFFKRKKVFPGAFIAWQVVNLIWMLMAFALTQNAFRDYYEASGVSFWGDGNGRTLVGALLGIAIWTGYMLNSVRVRNTFVR
ncbi:DUF2569 domain-containing protein [Devosia salina]|uniref:DUF2569 domain-containing protein n=1 Tax=Devosia salina TaxID=2860336 RepID=A0ABX8W9D7_9HYPH|nr:DUF2569 domain-containing protein [Devosia salina]QYO75311.1 DUF2569 domain-containing protein [Devosia salina]